MSLEKASISWSAKQLKNMIANGKIDFNHIIQRSYVWERKRKSALIESMIIGYPIPPVFAKRFDDGTGKRGGNIYCIKDKKPMPTHVGILCKIPSTALCETIYTVTKDRLGDFVRSCTDKEMAEINRGMLCSLGITAPVAEREVKTSENADTTSLAVEKNLYKTLYEQLLDKFTAR